MQIKIIEKHFGGVEFTPEMRVLHLGGHFHLFRYLCFRL